MEKQKEEVIEEEDENKAIGANEICSDFLKYIKIFIAAICKNYDDLIGVIPPKIRLPKEKNVP